MKTASNVFSVIGIIANTIVCLTFLQYPIPFIVGAGIFWIISFITAICGLTSYKKSVGLGILMILFVNLFSGIFYLCWED